MNTESDTHAQFMRIALQEAQIAFEKDEVPVGACVVSNNQVIARAHNLSELLNDVTAHAEMQVTTMASNYLGKKYLEDCQLYVTLQPCNMCAGAIYWARYGTLIFGASNDGRGYASPNELELHPKTKVISGIMESECAQILKDFFESKRK